MKLVCGFGINDADYVTQPKVNGKTAPCLFYRKWQGMIARCYSGDVARRNPTYVGCSVCEAWRSFTSFKTWMRAQDFVGKSLDKDLLVLGNRVYSPDTCLFVSRAVNSFMIDSGASRGRYLIGVYFHRAAGKYGSQISGGRSNPTHLGYFTTETEAHLAWAYAKQTRAYELASEQTDERVARALHKFGERVVTRAQAERITGRPE